MGFIFGVVKFVVGAGVGSVVGAIATTFFLTRDGGETVAKLQGAVNNMLQGAKDAYAEEERRQEGRRQMLIQESGEERRMKRLEAKNNKKK
jgi:hypothetical protein